MAGEWRFTFLGDKSTFQLKEYQNLLVEIRENYAELIPYKKENNQVEEFWLPKETEFGEQGPPDNIFAKFSYECKHHNWHANPSWILYWNPTIVGNPMSDVHALCAPKELTIVSVDMQKKLADAFPNHFQLFYELGTSGPSGNKCHYFGVTPEGFGTLEEFDLDWSSDESGGCKVGRNRKKISDSDSDSEGFGLGFSSLQLGPAPRDP